jgi:hypothetical protein
MTPDDAARIRAWAKAAEDAHEMLREPAMRFGWHATWQPIETAPRDGTPLLLFATAKGATAAVAVVGWYLPGEYEGLGWVECAFWQMPQGIEPTHWMPLPPSPEPSQSPSASDLASGAITEP